MRFLVFSALVILQNILISTEADKTFLLHLRWLPTYCYQRECQVQDDQKWDIGKLRVVPHVDWSSEECLHNHRFWRYDLSGITELSKYWSNPLDDFTNYYYLYQQYAACMVVDIKGPSPNLYFNRGIDLFKTLSATSMSGLVSEGASYSTEEFEHSLLNTFHVQPKVICAENELNETFLHEIVFCFNEQSSLTDCPAEYANDLQIYPLVKGVHTGSEFRQQIDRQKLCGVSFTVPAYRIPTPPTEAPEDSSTDDASGDALDGVVNTLSSSLDSFFNWLNTL